MEKVLVKNAADEEQVKKAEKAEKLQETQFNQDMRFVLSHPQGRRVLWKYLTECGVNRTSFNDSANTMYFLEGQRNVGLRILADITEADEAAYFKMSKEGRESKK